MDKVSISISSHNINGFKQDYLNSRCENAPSSIFCVQEHWLRPSYKKIRSVNQLRVVHPLFDGYGVSAMKESHYQRVNTGRGYGGTGFIFNKTFSPFLKPVIKYESDRLTVLEIKDRDGPILLVNVYCPYKQNGDEHKIQYLEMLGRIENVLSSNPSARFIVLGDFNYDLYDKSQSMSIAAMELLDGFEMVCTHDLDEDFCRDNSYTRCCESNNSYSLLDYVFISRTLRDRVKNCHIYYDGGNPSDHFPVHLELEVVPQCAGTGTGNGSNLESTYSSINWSTVNKDDLLVYESVMEELLDSLQVPSNLLHGDRYCTHEHHLIDCENYFESLIEIVAIADSYIPRKSPNGKRGKGFWNESLTHLKNDSVECYNRWNECGRPSSGPLFDRKKDSHYRFKVELRRQRSSFAARKSEDLNGKLLDKNFTRFWKDWKQISQVKCPIVNRIDDAVGETEIAETFKSYFQQIYGDNDSEAHNKLKEEFERKFPAYFEAHRHNSIAPYLLSWDDMLIIIGKLQKGKSTNSFFKAEHILYGSPKFTIHLHILFNALIQHGYVPTKFLRGTITPTVKEASSDLGSVENYRGVTLSGVYSHLFENALRLKFGHFLSSDDLQFGFKSKHSTCHAVFTLKTCVEYFTKRDSNVFVTFLDFSKAFDKVSHHGLLLKLMNRGVPLCFLLIILYWYLNMEYCCKWGDTFSEFFRVLCGTKQGGILSPEFFAIYIDDLIKELRKSKIGCHVLGVFIASILFADDMTLVAPTRSTMQRLLEICDVYCQKFCLKFNVRKTKTMVFGKMHSLTNSLTELKLRGIPIEYVEKYRYLGFHVVSGNSFKLSSTECLRGFFGAVNSVMTVLKKPPETVLMQLLYTNCVPKLTYGAAIRDLSAAEKHRFNVAVNNAIRAIFKFRYWQSIRQIREFFYYDSIEVIFAKAQKRFLSAIQNHRNGVLRLLSAVVTEPASEVVC